ncbi:hypothetical protein [Mesorhizobium sp. LSHC414A00]|uniref:hypothetical protein n=1 Tax=Mesorhizobium sp. LSHC414A00 TaxID=1287287 RepID=UPI0003CF03FF|nr:hypothetical protein [Mesorhizobium sp. LSHC414A00]ESX78479.1 hypothetical protein X757_08920 [Mesorhizobium sp. LSHC414A00]
MPKLLYGLNGSVPVVKVMKDNADGMSTPNSDTGKFAFNSEQGGNRIGFILDIIVVEPDFVTYPTGGTPSNPSRYYLPPGSNQNNSEITVSSWSNSGTQFQFWSFFPSYFQNKYGISYVPLCETRQVLPSAYVAKNAFTGPALDLATGQVSGSGQIYSYGQSFCRWMMQVDSGYNGGAGRNRPGIKVELTNNSGAPFVISRALLSVYALPATDDAIPDYSTVPVSGQEVVRCDTSSGGLFRIALPGRTIADPDLNHFLMHEDRIPAKILGAGEIAVASGGTAVITARFNLPLTTYMDYIVRRAGSTATEKFQFWHPPYIDSLNLNQECGFTYVVSGNTITITSTADMDIVIRYMICANAGNVFSSGGKKIQLVGNDGIGDYWQIKRPGSSDVAPTLDDIMLDSRIVYAPLLAEGFLNFNSTDMPDTMSAPRFKGERKRSLVIPNPNGLLLFPKVGAVYNQVSNDADYNEPLTMWNEHGVGVNVGSDSGKTVGYSVWANIIDETHLDIWSGGNNAYTYLGGTSFYDNTIKGVRYYVFGIPPSL